MLMTSHSLFCLQLQLVYVNWMFFISKILELADTVSSSIVNI